MRHVLRQISLSLFIVVSEAIAKELFEEWSDFLKHCLPVLCLELQLPQTQFELMKLMELVTYEQ
jgi:hypothetical protein